MILWLQHELQAILTLGVPPERIIYANPCKQVSHLKYAARKGVELMTFDNEGELHKVKEYCPNAKYVVSKGGGGALLTYAYRIAPNFRGQIIS